MCRWPHSANPLPPGPALGAARLRAPRRPSRRPDRWGHGSPRRKATARARRRDPAGAEGAPPGRDVRAPPAPLASSALSAGGCEETFLAASPPASPGGSPKGSRPCSPLPTPQAPRVDLQGAELWKRFHEIGTEMIITKAGR